MCVIAQFSIHGMLNIQIKESVNHKFIFFSKIGGFKIVIDMLEFNASLKPRNLISSLLLSTWKA